MMVQRSMKAPAKINLYLEILSQRADGYHDLETVMAAVDIFDRLTLRIQPEVEERNCLRILTAPGTCRLGVCSRGGPRPVPGAFPAHPNSVQGGLTSDQSDHLSDGLSRNLSEQLSDNLVSKAVELFQCRAGIAPGVTMELVKIIPLQAGLGGGSSDAAAALILANRVWGVHWSRQRLAELAAELGSDVPFFLFGGPARCWQPGHRVQPLLARQAPGIVIVKPPGGVSTERAFSLVELSGRPRSPNDLIGALAGSSFHRLARGLFNRFQTVTGLETEWTERLAAEFGRVACAGHQVTGSGSAYFGLFPNYRVARRAANVLRARLPDSAVYCARFYRRMEFEGSLAS